MKNVILNEQQFKQYIKMGLMEDNNKLKAALEKLKANKAEQEVSKEDISKKVKEMTKMINDWARDPSCEMTIIPSELNIDPKYTSPITFDEYIEREGIPASKSDNIRRQLVRRATDAVRGTNITTDRDATYNPKNVKNHRKEGEDQIEHRRKQIAGWQNREAYDKKIEKDKADNKFKETLMSVAYNPTEENMDKLDRSGNPDLTNDRGFQTFKAFCDNLKVICTNQGDVYIPVKISGPKWREMNKPTINQPIMFECLVENIAKMDFDKIVSRFKGKITDPHLKFVGFGDENKSVIIEFNYIPEQYRSMMQ